MKKHPYKRHSRRHSRSKIRHHHFRNLNNRKAQSFWRRDHFHGMRKEEHLAGKRLLLPHEWDIAFSPVKAIRRSREARSYRLYITRPLKRYFAKTRLARTHMGMEMAPAQWKQIIRARAKEALRKALQNQPLQDLDVWFLLPWTW
ncbi:hypothetical protein [Deinococcus roseus]|uniref:Uncharacterized protein n=1 Tax=Deinococcus roseus TaxID=392414 RepID=A0ABQ2D9Z1_9DEIO|nr:hypothetical protein [Deinococcus roseus]GGJ48737.1 hypothetical protein GCM10008938_38450 [Deinococcus roseus]